LQPVKRNIHPLGGGPILLRVTGRMNRIKFKVMPILTVVWQPRDGFCRQSMRKENNDAGL